MCGVFHGLVDGELFLGVEVCEHKVRGIEPRRRLSDPDSQAGHFECSESTEDIGESFLATGGPLFSESKPSQRQVEVIADDEDVCGIDFVEVEQRSDGLSAVVHEGLRCDEQQPRLVDIHFADLCIEAIASGDFAEVSSEFFEDIETDVVSSVSVAWAGVAQSHDDLHGRLLFVRVVVGIFFVVITSDDFRFERSGVEFSILERFDLLFLANLHHSDDDGIEFDQRFEIAAEFDVGDGDRVADFEFVDPQRELFGHFGGQAVDTNGMERLFESSAAVGPGCGASEFDRHVDFDSLVGVDSQQVKVIQIDAEGVPLKFAKHRLLLRPVDLDVEHTDTTVDETSQLAGVDLDRKRFVLVTVEHTGGLSGFAKALAGSRPGFLVRATGQFNLLVGWHG